MDRDSRSEIMRDWFVSLDTLLDDRLILRCSFSTAERLGSKFARERWLQDCLVVTMAIEGFTSSLNLHIRDILSPSDVCAACEIQNRMAPAYPVVPFLLRPFVKSTKLLSC